MSCSLAQVNDLFPALTQGNNESVMMCDFIYCFSYFRQRDSAKGDQHPQGELEQHGGAPTGGAGGLQSKKAMLKLISCRQKQY